MAGFNDTMVVALMGRYAVNDAFALAARGEYWTNGVAGGGDRSTAEEVTIGGAFPMSNRLEARLEVRADLPAEDMRSPTATGCRRRQHGHGHRRAARLVLS